MTVVRDALLATFRSRRIGVGALAGVRAGRLVGVLTGPVAGVPAGARAGELAEVLADVLAGVVSGVYDGSLGMTRTSEDSRSASPSTIGGIEPDRSAMAISAASRSDPVSAAASFRSAASDESRARDAADSLATSSPHAAMKSVLAAIMIERWDGLILQSAVWVRVTICETRAALDARRYEQNCGWP